jgi:hypothetical protein
VSQTASFLFKQLGYKETREMREKKQAGIKAKVVFLTIVPSIVVMDFALMINEVRLALINFN